MRIHQRQKQGKGFGVGTLLHVIQEVDRLIDVGQIPVGAATPEMLGRYILAGLELLIVSDIIHTSLSLALADLLYLGVLVLIRSLISYFLDRELGALRQELEGGGDPGRQVPKA